jgi:hypothetical protein
MRRFENWLILGSLFVSLFASGCDPGRPVTGGTAGIIHCNGIALDSIEIQVHRRKGATFEAVGSGVSGPDGRFQLVQPKASGPLYLEPGEYHFTLESVGPVSLNWEAEFQDPSRTPLHCQWMPTDGVLDLDVPEPE